MSAEPFVSVTEIQGDLATREQLQRILQRYRWAATFCSQKDVIELACGAGMGLGLLEASAKSVRAGDIEPNLVKLAKAAAPSNVEVKVVDALRLPYPDGSCDVTIIFEAIYYLSDFDSFLDEVTRVLRADGELLIVSANPQVFGFHPSKWSVRYHTTAELRILLENRGFDVEFWGSWPISSADNGLTTLRSWIKKCAVSLGVMPKGKRLKQLAKRLFYGPLLSIPMDIAKCNLAYQEPERLSSDADAKKYMTYFCRAIRRSAP